MSWNEQDHPRADDGKFTFKNGTKKESETIKSENPAEILYGKSLKEEKERKNLRNSLLKELGNDLTPAQVLYSSNEELEKIKEEKEAPKGYKAKLLDKIPIEKKIEKIVSAKLMLDDYDKQEIPINNVEQKGQNNAVFSPENTKRAREFIQGSEGFRDIAYQDTAGVWTIGYGHTGYVNGKPISKGMKISKEKAEELYKKDFETHVAPLKDIKTPLSENQKIALASLIYNVGPGVMSIKHDLRKKLEAGDIKGVADEFDRYVYVTNKNTGKKEISKGLVNRRKREKELFLKPDEEP